MLIFKINEKKYKISPIASAILEFPQLPRHFRKCLISSVACDIDIYENRTRFNLYKKQFILTFKGRL